jgi:hypothetical protein
VCGTVSSSRMIVQFWANYLRGRPAASQVRVYVPTSARIRFLHCCLSCFVIQIKADLFIPSERIGVQKFAATSAAYLPLRNPRGNSVVNGLSIAARLNDDRQVSHEGKR